MLSYVSYIVINFYDMYICMYNSIYVTSISELLLLLQVCDHKSEYSAKLSTESSRLILNSCLIKAGLMETRACDIGKVSHFHPSHDGRNAQEYRQSNQSQGRQDMKVKKFFKKKKSIPKR